MDKFLMNVYRVDKKFSHTVQTNVLFFDPRTELRVVECNGIFYVVDCEGDAQARGSYIPVGLHNAEHAMRVFNFIAIEGDY